VIRHRMRCPFFRYTWGTKNNTYTIYYLKLIDADQRRNLVDFMTTYPSKL
jgi:hypothetical protein